MAKFNSTILPQDNNPEEIKKSTLDLLDKVNTVSSNTDASVAIVSNSLSDLATSYAAKIEELDAIIDYENQFLADSFVTQGGYQSTTILTKANTLISSSGDSSGANMYVGLGAYGVYDKPPTPVSFLGETGSIVKVINFMCNGYALFDTGNFYSWGYNARGQLGFGDTTQRSIPTLAATDVTDFLNINHVGFYYHDYITMMIKKKDGSWYGCGYNGYGQLGLGNTTQQNSFVELPHMKNVRKVWMNGARYSSIIMQQNDGTIMAGGYNTYGQLGAGDKTTENTYRDVTDAWTDGEGGTIETLVGAAGYYSSSNYTHGWISLLIRNKDNSSILKVAGDNSWYACGNGTTTDQTTPYQPVFDGNNIIAEIGSISSSPGSIWARTKDNKVWRWGHNNGGVLGTGNTTGVSEPYNSGDLDNIDNNCSKLGLLNDDAYNYGHVAAYFLQHTDGFWWATGNGTSGQLCTGAIKSSSTFLQTLLPTNLKEIISNNYGNVQRSYLGITEDGKVIGWGYGGRSIWKPWWNSSVSTWQVLSMKA